MHDTPSGQIACPVGQGIPGALRCCLRRPRTHTRVRLMHGDAQIISFLVRHQTSMRIFLGKHTTTEHTHTSSFWSRVDKSWNNSRVRHKILHYKNPNGQTYEIHTMNPQGCTFLVRGVWMTIWVANNVDLRGQYIHYLIILQTAFRIKIVARYF